ncbi:unnamed protein product [Durusdinium trenchii]|uniref:Uncharacterized protein n=1 Tax=Durusdinium trenchii TaxID=1381693 RepID=A0ABP0S7R2_9DINO
MPQVGSIDASMRQKYIHPLNSRDYKHTYRKTGVTHTVHCKEFWQALHLLRRGWIGHVSRAKCRQCLSLLNGSIYVAMKSSNLCAKSIETEKLQCQNASTAMPSDRKTLGQQANQAERHLVTWCPPTRKALGKPRLLCKHASLETG